MRGGVEELALSNAGKVKRSVLRGFRSLLLL
jgi:hypothetical protein